MVFFLSEQCCKKSNCYFQHRQLSMEFEILADYCVFFILKSNYFAFVLDEEFLFILLRYAASRIFSERV